MYTQVYFHPVRRIYDIHLKDFLAEWLTEGKFPTNIEVLKKITDNEVLSAILSASSDDSQNGHDPAHRIINREHYKLLYRKNPEDIRLNPESGRLVFETIKNIHGFEAVRRDQYTQKNSSLAFPVLCNNNRIVSSYDESEALQKLPIASFDYVFIRPDLFKETEDWLKKNLTDVIKIVPEED
jgi:HD superfamily phosphohydrolase